MPTAVWRVEFDRTAARDLKKLGTEAERRVLSFLRTRIAGCADPRTLGKPLTGDRQGFWRYRVGDYRLVAAIEDTTFIVLVVTVGHRRDVYR
jgi:mRNA interferase RelE/StbE